MCASHVTKVEAAASNLHASCQQRVRVADRSVLCRPLTTLSCANTEHAEHVRPGPNYELTRSARAVPTRVLGVRAASAELVLVRRALSHRTSPCCTMLDATFESALSPPHQRKAAARPATALRTAARAQAKKRARSIWEGAGGAAPRLARRV